MKLIVIELHNPSSQGTSGVLSASENTLFYNEKAAITSGTYKKLFKSPGKCRRRLAILKISYTDEFSKRHVIWRAANTKGITDVRENCIGLPFEALWELNATKTSKNEEVIVEVTRGYWLPFYFCHPNHAARISTRIGLFSIIITICSMIITIICK